MKMKYKVKNKLEQNIRLGKIEFGPKEEKILDICPTSDRFDVEKIEEPEKKINKTRRK